jgi:hypothetical protein
VSKKLSAEMQLFHSIGCIAVFTGAAWVTDISNPEIVQNVGFFAEGASLAFGIGGYIKGYGDYIYDAFHSTRVGPSIPELEVRSPWTGHGRYSLPLHNPIVRGPLGDRLSREVHYKPIEAHLQRESLTTWTNPRKALPTEPDRLPELTSKLDRFLADFEEALHASTNRGLIEHGKALRDGAEVLRELGKTLDADPDSQLEQKAAVMEKFELKRHLQQLVGLCRRRALALQLIERLKTKGEVAVDSRAAFDEANVKLANFHGIKQKTGLPAGEESLRDSLTQAKKAYSDLVSGIVILIEESRRELEEVLNAEGEGRLLSEEELDGAVGIGETAKRMGMAARRVGARTVGTRTVGTQK